MAKTIVLTPHFIKSELKFISKYRPVSFLYDADSMDAGKQRYVASIDNFVDNYGYEYYDLDNNCEPVFLHVGSNTISSLEEVFNDIQNYLVDCL